MAAHSPTFSRHLVQVLQQLGARAAGKLPCREAQIDLLALATDAQVGQAPVTGNREAASVLSHLVEVQLPNFLQLFGRGFSDWAKTLRNDLLHLLQEGPAHVVSGHHCA